MSVGLNISNKASVVVKNASGYTIYVTKFHLPFICFSQLRDIKRVLFLVQTDRLNTIDIQKGNLSMYSSQHV